MSIDPNREKPLPFDTYARFATGVAYQAARRWRHPEVLTGHVLYGLAQVAPELLPPERPDEVLRTLRARLENAGVEPSDAIQPLRYAEDVEVLFARARRHAFEAGGTSVGPAHLVSALRAHRNAVCDTLLGLDGTAEIPSRAPADRERAAPGGLEWITLSDEAPTPYSQQLAEAIKDAVATGKILPGQRLPALRRLAETLDLAPGTVAKAYRALDAEGVIETAGSKGTTVSLPAPGPEPAPSRVEALSDLLRPVAVAAFHMGGTFDELEAALRRASGPVFRIPRQGGEG